MEAKTKKIIIGFSIFFFLLIIFLVWYFFFRAKKPANTEAINARVKAYHANGGAKWTDIGDDKAKWGDFAANIKVHLCNVSGSAPDTGTNVDCWTQKYEPILGFFKAYDIAPAGWNVFQFKNEIQSYLAAGGAGRNLVMQGEFLTA